MTPQPGIPIVFSVQDANEVAWALARTINRIKAADPVRARRLARLRREILSGLFPGDLYLDPESDAGQWRPTV